MSMIAIVELSIPHPLPIPLWLLLFATSVGPMLAVFVPRPFWRMIPVANFGIVHITKPFWSMISVLGVCQFVVFHFPFSVAVSVSVTFAWRFSILVSVLVRGCGCDGRSRQC